MQTAGLAQSAKAWVILSYPKQETHENDLDQLREFRQRVYESMGTARDAQFELVDALLLNSEGRSVVELSLNPAFRRAWSSVYAALSDGQINTTRLERLYIL